MIFSPTVSATLVVALLVVSLYLATRPRQSGSAQDVPGDDALFDGWHELGLDERRKRLAAYRQQLAENGHAEGQPLRPRRGLCM